MAKKFFDNCKVIEAGIADDDVVYIKLQDNKLITFPDKRNTKWYCATDSQKKEMLAVALAAITANLPVEAELEIPPMEYATVCRLYLKNQ